MKKIALFVITFFGVFHFACKERSDDGCGDISYPTKFHITSFQMTQKNMSMGAIDTSTYSSYDNLLLAFSIKDKVDLVHFEKPMPLLLFNSAYACTPPIPQSIETINSIDIIARSILKTTNDSINIGDTITHYFLAKVSSANNFESIVQVIDKQKKLEFNSPLLVKFNLKPESPNDFLVDISIKLSDNSVHKFENQKLKIR